MNAAKTAAIGSVVTQAIKIVRIIRHRAAPFIVPMPNRAPQDTCVVETGRPKPLATAVQTVRKKVWSK